MLQLNTKVPWTVYTDSGSLKKKLAVKPMCRDVPLSEQGMQDDGMAHSEGEEETKQEHQWKN